MTKTLLHAALFGNACVAWMLLGFGCPTDETVEGSGFSSEECPFDLPLPIKPTDQEIEEAQNLLDKTFREGYFVKPPNGKVKHVMVILPGLNSPSEKIFKQQNGKWVFGDPQEKWGRDDVFVVIPSPTERDGYWDIKKDGHSLGKPVRVTHAWFEVKSWTDQKEHTLPADFSDVENTKPLFTAFFDLLYKKLQADYNLKAPLTHADTHLMGISLGGATAAHIAIHGDMVFQRVTIVQGFYPPFAPDGSLMKVEARANTAIPKMNILWSPEDQLIHKGFSQVLITSLSTYGYGQSKVNEVRMDGTNHVGFPPVDGGEPAQEVVDMKKGEFYAVHHKIMKSINSCVDEWLQSYRNVKVGGKTH